MLNVCGSVVFGCRVADFVCVCARMVGSSVAVVLLVVSVRVDLDVVFVCSRIVGSRVSVIGGEFIIRNYVSLSCKVFMNISVIGFVWVLSVVEV